MYEELEEVSSKLKEKQDFLNNLVSNFMTANFNELGDFYENNKEIYFSYQESSTNEEDSVLLLKISLDSVAQIIFYIGEKNQEAFLDVDRREQESDIDCLIATISYLKNKIKLKNSKEVKNILKELMITIKLSTLKNDIEEKIKDHIKINFTVLFEKYLKRLRKKEVESKIKELKTFDSEDKEYNEYNYTVMNIQDDRITFYQERLIAFQNPKRVTFYNSNGNCIPLYEVFNKLFKQVYFNSVLIKNIKDLTIFSEFNSYGSIDIPKEEVYKRLKKIDSIRNF